MGHSPQFVSLQVLSIQFLRASWEQLSFLGTDHWVGCGCRRSIVLLKMPGPFPHHASTQSFASCLNDIQVQVWVSNGWGAGKMGTANPAFLGLLSSR